MSGEVGEDTVTMKMQRVAAAPNTQLVMILVAVLGAGTGGTALVTKGDAKLSSEDQERLLRLEMQLEQLGQADAIDDSQSEQLGKLWRRTSENQGAINDLRDGINSRHPDKPPLPRHEFEGN